MFREYLRLRNHVTVPWKFFYAGLACMILYVLTNGISLSTVVPLMDRIFAGRAIVVPQNVPAFIRIHCEGLVRALNETSQILLLRNIIFFIIGIIFLKGGFFYLQTYLFQYFSHRTLTDIRDRLYANIMHLSMDFFTTERSGEMTSRIIYDVNILGGALSVDLPNLFLKTCEAAFFLVIIFVIDWKLALFALLIFPMLLLPVFNVSKKLRKLSGRIQEGYGDLGAVIQEGIYGQQVIKAYNREETVIAKFAAANETIFHHTMAIFRRTAAINPYTELTGAICASGLMFYGARLVIAGTMSPGFFFLFLAGLFSLISPLKTVGTAYANMKQAGAALPRIYALLEEKRKTADTGTKRLAGVRETIEYRSVGFKYGDKEIFHDMSFFVRKGEKIGIVGPTGAGKTTLAGLLLRFYEPASGGAYIDGTDIREFTLASLRNNVGLVTQEPILFRDTVAHNITLGDSTDGHRMRLAAQAACISEVIEKLPDRYDTVVGERGTTLSGGQKQLLTIARAMYKNPPVLILDEATASLDSNSERLLQTALERIMEGRTVFIIAHRLSTLRHADRIIVLDGGRLVETGTHEELFEKKGLYHKLWMLQFSG